jgi:hypothetical protein
MTYTIYQLITSGYGWAVLSMQIMQITGNNKKKIVPGLRIRIRIDHIYLTN